MHLENPIIVFSTSLSLKTNFKTQSNNFLTNRIFNSDLSNFISDLKLGYVTFCITDEVRVMPTKNLICFEILGLSFEIGLLKYVFPRSREQIKNLSGNSYLFLLVKMRNERPFRMNCSLILIV